MRELVGRAHERHAGQSGDLLGDEARKSPFGIKAGADRGAALRQRIEVLHRPHDALVTSLHLRGVAGKFLTKR